MIAHRDNEAKRMWTIPITFFVIITHDIIRKFFINPFLKYLKVFFFGLKEKQNFQLKKILKIIFLKLLYNKQKLQQTYLS